MQSPINLDFAAFLVTEASKSSHDNRTPDRQFHGNATYIYGTHSIAAGVLLSASSTTTNTDHRSRHVNKLHPCSDRRKTLPPRV